MENQNGNEVNTETTAEATQEPAVNDTAEAYDGTAGAQMHCPNCQTLNEAGQFFCLQCGTPLKRICPQCGAEVLAEHEFCMQCGAKVSDIQPTHAVDFASQVGTNAAPQKKSKVVPIVIISSIAAVVVIAILISVMTMALKMNMGVNFKREFSDIAGKSYCEIAKDGSYMIIDTNPRNIDDYYDANAFSKVKEVNERLGFSSSVYQKMLQTRALDGRLSEQTKQYKVSWTYHPNKGLEVMYEKR